MKIGNFNAMASPPLCSLSLSGDLSELTRGRRTGRDDRLGGELASVMLSSRWLMLAWIFCTGRRRLQRENCGQSSFSVMQLTIRSGPSMARTTCPTVISVWSRAST